MGCASLERLAAQGALISQDDTAVRMLALLGEHRTRRAHAEALGLSRPTERTGMSTTAWVVQGGEHTICLDDAGRTPAGETLATRWTQRAADPGKPLVLSEACAAHEAEEGALMRCHCLAPGRRPCSALADVLPHACQGVIEALQQGLDHDDQARDAPRSPAARLAYHRDARGPMRDARTRWLDTQWDERLGEPNSAVGKAMGARQGHGATLTRFVSAASAPLDTPRVERALTLCMRQRTNALCLATEHRADIVSVLTSLMATCLHAGGKALASLVAWQEHRREGWRPPAAWLPWHAQAPLVPPAERCRQSGAIAACCGWPFHSTSSNARAASRGLASAPWGHHVQRPCARRFVHRQKPSQAPHRGLSGQPKRQDHRTGWGTRL